MNEDVLLFRAFLDSLNDNFSAQWNNFKYNGRAENFYTYGGFTREISFSFKVAPQSGVELKPLYNKLNYLVGSTAPVYSNRRMRGRYVRLSIGNWCNEIPGFFTSIGLGWANNYPWEINYGGSEEPGADEPISQHPLILNVNCNFLPIHDFAPESRPDTPFIIPRQRTVIKDKLDVKTQTEPINPTDKIPNGLLNSNGEVKYGEFSDKVTDANNPIETTSDNGGDSIGATYYGQRIFYTEQPTTGEE